MRVESRIKIYYASLSGAEWVADESKGIALVDLKHKGKALLDLSKMLDIPEDLLQLFSDA